MTDQLAPRYARYGLMASMTLAAFDDLEERAGEETRVVPLGDDADRIERLRDMLAASFVGGVPPEQQKDAVFALSGHRRSPSDVDDSLIVASVLPDPWSLETFVPTAVRVLDTIKSEGIAPFKVTGAPDGEFFYGALRDFLDRLAHSSQSVRVSSRRSARHRYSLG